MKRSLLALAALVLPALAPAQEIKVGGIFDLTGITADVGKPFAQGVRDGVAWVNENGGINGKKIRLVDADYGYKIPEANALYKRLTGTEKVVMIQGWGTGDTEALKAVVAGDKVPYFSASFSAHLTDPSKTPYNFFVGPSYSDVLRSWLSWVKQDWKDKSRNPKVAFFYGDNAYGKAPIEAGRRYCKEVGVDLVAEEILPGIVQDATSQLLDMKQKGADYAFTQVTVTNFSVVLRDAKKLGLATKWGTNTWGLGENLIAVARDAAEGVVGAMLNPPFGEQVPGMQKVVDFHKKNHAGDTHDTNYVRGWSYVMVWAEGLKRADKANALTGEGIRSALETLKDLDLGGLAAPVTYAPDDHRGSTKVSLYQVQGGKLVKVGDFDQPRKKDWLGL
ncbi:MAG TPA: ABC transporter substrate-binding protein [Anaeromyxobacteraceae bacterium]|nr:ABC transporter substrate-binding protein [Anaeromyxobacteraceae bacterium]